MQGVKQGVSEAPSSKKAGMSKDMLMGLLYLFLNLLISVAAQFVLKAAMAELGEFGVGGSAVDYLLQMINVKVIGGLVLYASGVVLWLLCLSKLDLSFAYPAATLQYFLVFLGAWWLFDESIPLLRIAGLIVIAGGVIVMSLDQKQTNS
jgi:drug/metabolite transporter (DMT)-like permease